MSTTPFSDGGKKSRGGAAHNRKEELIERAGSGGKKLGETYRHPRRIRRKFDYLVTERFTKGNGG